MKERIAIVEGKRSAFTKAGSILKHLDADDLGAHVLKSLLASSQCSMDDIDEVIIGNVSQPSKAANIARVIALKAAMPIATPAYTVHRNCASGMEAVSTAINKILVGKAGVVVAGGTESMSNIPLLYSPQMKRWFEQFSRAKTFSQKLGVIKTFKLAYLKPTIALLDGLTDPICGQLMGNTAENLANEFSIERQEQDHFALNSHLKALKAQQDGFFDAEITPIISMNGLCTTVNQDNGPRADQSIQKLQKLKPYFDRKLGTVTVGNSCPITDGAVMMTLMTETEAKKHNYSVLGYVTAYDYAGCDPHRMGLGPVYAMSKLFSATGYGLKDMDLFEINAYIVFRINKFNLIK